MNISELQAMRASLVDALSQGARRVNFMEGGTRREVEYHSLKEMRDAIAALDLDIAAQSGRRVDTILLSFERGD